MKKFDFTSLSADSHDHMIRLVHACDEPRAFEYDDYQGRSQTL